MFVDNLEKIVYVMMDKNYTTVSKPKSIDGFLGVMIGDSIWQGCFSENDIEPTAEFIAEQVGDNARHIEGYVRNRSGNDSLNSEWPDDLVTRMYVTFMLLVKCVAN